MSKQVLDIKQMQHLKRLGVDTDKATMAYIINITDKYKPFLCLSSDAIDHVDFDNYALGAFTLQDILDLIPRSVDAELLLFIDKGKNKWRIGYTDIESNEIFEDFSDKNFIDAAYEMLCWCAENGFVKTNKED